MSPKLDRREFIKLAAASAVSAGVPASARVPSAPESLAPTHALSLRELGRQARSTRPLSNEAKSLAGFERFSGFVRDDEGDVILLGQRGRGSGSHHIDDLAVVLRHALLPGAGRKAIGCTIDPIPSYGDPWAIQKAAAYGIPACHMAQRMIKIDEDLKWASAGLRRFGRDLQSLWDLERDQLLGLSAGTRAPVESTHRFWFAPSYPSARPRFRRAEAGVIVEQPVGVQLLTERDFLDESARAGANLTAASLPREWASRVSSVIPSVVPDLVNDFRLIEIGVLLAYVRVNPEALGDLLRHHRLEQVQLPGFVGGVRREETGRRTLGHEIVHRRTSNGTETSITEKIESYSMRHRGGVKANIEIFGVDEGHASTRIVSEAASLARNARGNARQLWWRLHGPE